MRSAAAHRQPDPRRRPSWGAREVEVDLDDVFPYLDRHVLFKLHWGGRGVKGEAWRELVEGTDEEEGFAPRLERMWREQDYLHPRARLGYFPCNADGNELVVFDPEDPERELERLVFPRQPKHDRICLADFYRPLDSGERDVVALQGVTVGPEVTELIERLGARRRVRRAALRPRARRPVGRGPGRVAALRGPPRARHRRSTRAAATPGATPPARTSPSTRRSGACSTSKQIGMTLSDGFAVMPEQSTVAIVAHHPQAVYFGMKSGFIPEEKAPDELIGMSLSDGFAVTPEQSTVAIVAHHPQAVYFGMKSGFIPEDQAPDELIAGTERGGEIVPSEPAK